MSTRVKISSPSIKDNKRSDSPGYFTLSSNSDSDTGDCTGDISAEDDDQLGKELHPPIIWSYFCKNNLNPW